MNLCGQTNIEANVRELCQADLIELFLVFQRVNQLPGPLINALVCLLLCIGIYERGGHVAFRDEEQALVESASQV